MAFGDSTANEATSAYSIGASIANTGMSIMIDIRDTSASPAADQADVKNAVQTIVDLLHDSPVFTGVSAGRTYPISQEITATT